MNNATSFLTKLVEDQGLQATLMVAVQTAVTKEEKVAATTKVANEAGFAVSADELQKMVESIQSSSAKLTDDDLENVAGGRGGGGAILGAAVGGMVGGAVESAAGAVGGVAGDVTGAMGDAVGAVGGAAEDVGNAVGGAAEDVGGAIASVFSGW